jgi:hypothetical protein
VPPLPLLTCDNLLQVVVSPVEIPVNLTLLSKFCQKEKLKNRKLSDFLGFYPVFSSFVGEFSHCGDQGFKKKRFCDVAKVATIQKLI